MSVYVFVATEVERLGDPATKEALATGRRDGADLPVRRLDGKGDGFYRWLEVGVYEGCSILRPA